ncbi:MAG TPA: hypothetical protein VFU04_07935 [Solirubrobacterales bacterium]|nr:hypothetical protein [Solirubrobacterales bacterium]
MARLFVSLPAVFGMSTCIAVLTGIAILGFGAPPKVLAFVAWGVAAVFTPLIAWSHQRLGRW